MSLIRRFTSPPYYVLMISQIRMMHIFRGSVFYLRIYLSSLISLHFISFSYLSFDVFCFVNNRPKRGRLSVQYLPSCVLEIVDRNRHGLICLLVHTERNSPCSIEENVVSGVQFEKLHRRISALQRRTSYIHWGLVDENKEVRKLTPQNFIADAKQLVRWFYPKKLTTVMGGEDELKT